MSTGTKGALGDATCFGGALEKVTTFGQVTWENVRRTDNHIHAKVQLTGVTQGTYDIFGNQDVLCDAIVDFDLRPAHKIKIIVDENGDGEARIGLTFGSEADPPILNGHAPGPHQLWLTITGPGGVFRSAAFEVVIKKHKGH